MLDLIEKITHKSEVIGYLYQQKFHSAFKNFSTTRTKILSSSLLQTYFEMERKKFSSNLWLKNGNIVKDKLNGSRRRFNSRFGDRHIANLPPFF
jgi:hypothetical protein